MTILAQTLTLTATIPSAIAELSPVVALWGVLRAIDRWGSGWVIVNLREVAKLLGKTNRTVEKYIPKGKGLKLFRYVERLDGDGNYLIYYSSPIEIAKANGITDLGAIVSIPLPQLGHLKCVTTEAVALQGQNQSVYAIKREAKENAQTVEIPTPDSLLAEPSDLMRGVLLAKGRFLIVGESLVNFGMSQETIASRIWGWVAGNYQPRSTRTIQRRLSNKMRLREGLRSGLTWVKLPPLRRRQLLNEIPYALYKALKDVGMDENLFAIHITKETKTPRSPLFDQRRNYKGFYRAFRTLPNVYGSQLELVPCRYRRKQLEKTLQSEPNHS